MRMLDLGSRPSNDVAQQTCSQLRPRSSRCLTSCGFSFSPASTAFQSKALTSGSMEVLDTIFVGLYRRLRAISVVADISDPASKVPIEIEEGYVETLCQKSTNCALAGSARADQPNHRIEKNSLRTRTGPRAVETIGNASA